MPNLYMRPKPLVIVIMDGVGIAPPGPGNAVSLAKTPNLDKLWPAYPHGSLYASGLSVGLPHGVDGNSEVGHSNLGAGKVVLQELPRIDNSIETGLFFKNQMLIDSIQNSINNKVHIVGLLSAGQVHSSYGHLLALMEMASKLKINKDNIFYHIFTDGRDSPPQSAIKLFQTFENDLENRNVGRIASIIGRYYAMDRDERWERTRQAYELITLAKGQAVKNWREAIEISYKKGKFDEYLESYVITDNGKPLTNVGPNDSVIFFNFEAISINAKR